MDFHLSKIYAVAEDDAAEGADEEVLLSERRVFIF